MGQLPESQRSQSRFIPKVSQTRLVRGTYLLLSCPKDLERKCDHLLGPLLKHGFANKGKHRLPKKKEGTAKEGEHHKLSKGLDHQWDHPTAPQVRLHGQPPPPPLREAPQHRQAAPAALGERRVGAVRIWRAAFRWVLWKAFCFLA